MEKVLNEWSNNESENEFTVLILKSKTIHNIIQVIQSKLIAENISSENLRHVYFSMRSFIMAESSRLLKSNLKLKARIEIIFLVHVSKGKTL